jgi:hypothetical protein
MMLLVRSTGMTVASSVVVVTVMTTAVLVGGLVAFHHWNERHAALRTFSRLFIGLGSFALHRTLIPHIGLR